MRNDFNPNRRPVTAKQINAYKEIKRKQLEDHQVKIYGMIPLKAKWPAVCGCGKHNDRKIMPGEQIVKFRGAWWAKCCVDQTMQDEFRATAKFVLEEKGSKERWFPKAWTNDAEEATKWKRLAEEMTAEGYPERVIER